MTNRLKFAAIIKLLLKFITNLLKLLFLTTTTEHKLLTQTERKFQTVKQSE